MYFYRGYLRRHAFERQLNHSLNENIVIDYHGTQFDTYTVEVGTFKCSFTPERIFYAVWKFEQLCHVRQENKARFTYGVEKREIITGKAMYIGKGEKVMKRKKTLVRLSEHVAYEPCKQFDSVDMYYFAGGIWYYVRDAYNENNRDFIAEKMEKEPENLKNLLSNWDYTKDIAINTIYKALRDVLCAEVIKDTSKEKECENEAENAVICDVVAGKNECGSFHVEQTEVKAIGNGLYTDSDDLYFEYEGHLYKVCAYTYKISKFFMKQEDIPGKIIDLVGRGILTRDDAKLLYGKLTEHNMGEPAKADSAQEETHEDYPPEPYNRTGEASCNDEAGSTLKKKAIRTTFIRQKAFPNELYYARRKIRRFKRLSFAGYTNYHSRGESSANRTQTAKTSYCLAAMARGSPKICIFAKKMNHEGIFE